ncbi:MAG: hypothetical protein IPM88_20815 [Nitrospira sp.]|nr:hypothetical protein [Nitrospira sp.]
MKRPLNRRRGDRFGARLHKSGRCPEGWSIERARARGLVGIRLMAAFIGFVSTLILDCALQVYPVFARVTATIS